MLPPRVELSDGVAVSIRYVPLPDELCNADERARNVSCIVL